MHLALRIFQRAAEIHQAAAFGVNRHAALMRRPQLGQHRRVGGKRSGVQFRVAAAEPDHLAIGKYRIMQWAKADKGHARAFQQRKIIRVVETESFIIRDREGKALAAGWHRWPLARR